MPDFAETLCTDRGWVERRPRAEVQTRAPTSARLETQPLNAALGQATLGRGTLADCRNCRIAVAMPPPPSLPDSMVIVHRPVPRRARRRDSLCAFPVGRKDRKLLSYFIPRRGHNSTDRTRFVRTHCSMSFRLDRFLKTFRTRRELKASTRFTARNRKKTATTLHFRKGAH